MQAVSSTTVGPPGGGLSPGRQRFHHLRWRPLYAVETAVQQLPPGKQRGQQGQRQQMSELDLPFDDNVHNRFHRQQPPLCNPLGPASTNNNPSSPATATAAAAAAAAQPHNPPRVCCSSIGSGALPKRRGGGGMPEDKGRKGVLGARLRRKQMEQQQQQQQQGSQLQGTSWRAQVGREERRRAAAAAAAAAAANKGTGKEDVGSGRRRGKGVVVTSSSNPFRQAYDDGRLPCSVLHHPGVGSGRRGPRVKWAIPLDALDTAHRVRLLPLFLAGILETRDPYRTLAVQGALDLIQACKAQLPAALPLLLPPLKAALASPDVIVVATGLKMLQDLVLADPARVGPALLPHYHSLLGAGAVFQRHKDGAAANQGRAVPTTGPGARLRRQQQRFCLRRLVNETLELLEATGGPQTFVHIRYVIPSYERTVHAF